MPGNTALKKVTRIKKLCKSYLSFTKGRELVRGLRKVLLVQS